jgi:hypothetical protein
MGLATLAAMEDLRDMGEEGAVGVWKKDEKV